MRKTTVLLQCLFLISVSCFSQSAPVYPDGLKAGDPAPEFLARDQSGRLVSLKQTLQKGPVVLVFYRGQWCPFCNKQLSQYNDSLNLLTAHGATVLAVTPENATNVRLTVEKTKASFSILSDTGLHIMKMYKVNFAVDEKTVARYKGYGIDFDQVNGGNGANLPVPATYIIDPGGKIRYVFFNTDYRKRASVLDILDHL